MTILKPDKTVTLGGVTVNEYLLTQHNPHHIAMPSASMEGNIIGVTIHNTDRISVISGTTPAEQYTRATVNGNMLDVRVHYYVDDVCAWQNLPLTLSGWHAADGSGDGNCRTIAIECIMHSAYDDRDKKAEDNAARLAAALLQKYGLEIGQLYTHQHWYNRKYCPAYILPHWEEFRAKVQEYLNDMTPDSAAEKLYRVRKKWEDANSQIGAFSVLDNAKTLCSKNAGYSVFDEMGRCLFPETEKKYTKGMAVKLNQAVLYASSSAKTGSVKSGTFYLYDDLVVNGRIRITNSLKNCGNTPIGKFVTGWVNLKDI